MSDENIDIDKLKRIADEMSETQSCSANVGHRQEKSSNDVERVSLWNQSGQFTLSENNLFESGAFYHFHQEGNVEGYFMADHYDSGENVLWAWCILSHEIKAKRDVLMLCREHEQINVDTPEFSFVLSKGIGIILTDNMVFNRCGLAETIEAKHQIHLVLAKYIKYDKQ